MKFYICEENIGDNVTKKDTEKVIKLLIDKGWDVEYGTKKNKTTDIKEFGQEEAIYDKFSADFMSITDQVVDD